MSRGSDGIRTRRGSERRRPGAINQLARHQIVTTTPARHASDDQSKRSTRRRCGF